MTYLQKLTEIDRDLWIAEQPFRYIGVEIGVRMTVVRLSNQNLAVISPIQINEELAASLDNIGTIEHVIAPNLYHHLFVGDFHARYPQPTLWASPGLESKRSDLPFDRVLGTDDEHWCDGLEYLFFDGLQSLGLGTFDPLVEYVFLHPTSRTLISTDIAFNFDKDYPPLTKFVARVLGGYNSPSPTWLEKVATPDRETVKKSVQNVLQWDFDRMIVAHGKIVERGAKQLFKEAYEKFLGQAIEVTA